MIIRKAQKKDLKEIAKLIKTEYAKKPHFEKWSDEVISKTVKDYFKAQDIFVAEIDKKLVGFIVSYTFWWEYYRKGMIDEFVVNPNFQGKGIGTFLLQKLEEDYSKKDVRCIDLLTHKLAPAINFYKKRGYKPGQLVLLGKKLRRAKNVRNFRKR